LDCPQKVRHFLGAFLFMGISKYSLEFKKNCVETIIRDSRCEQSPASEQINKRNPTGTRLHCGADKQNLTGCEILLCSAAMFSMMRSLN